MGVVEPLVLRGRRGLGFGGRIRRFGFGGGRITRGRWLGSVTAGLRTSLGRRRDLGGGGGALLFHEDLVLGLDGLPCHQDYEVLRVELAQLVQLGLHAADVVLGEHQLGLGPDELGVCLECLGEVLSGGTAVPGAVRASVPLR